jgi:hypothetical protein
MPRFNNPVNLKNHRHDDAEEWASLGVDVKAQAFRGFVGKSGQRGQKGAGHILRRAC